VARLAAAVRYTAFGLLTLYLVLGGAFIVGETMTDPGGIAGAALVAAWLVPAAGLGVFAARRPARAAGTLTVVAVAVAGFVLLDGLTLLVPTDRVGPVGSIVVFATAAALDVLGLRRPLRAGALLVLLGGANLAGVAGKMADGAPLGAALTGSAGAVAVPVLLAGLLFLLAGALAGTGRTAPAGSAPATARNR
jgi:hypothetical protein